MTRMLLNMGVAMMIQKRESHGPMELILFITMCLEMNDIGGHVIRGSTASF